MNYTKFLKDYISAVRKLVLREVLRGNEQNAIILLKQIRSLKQDGYNKGVTLKWK